MYKVQIKDYMSLLEKCYNVKSPLYVYGGPGIGKSEAPRQVFPKVALEMKRKYVEWTDLTLDEKKACIAAPEKYWVFCDQRVGQMDSTDLRGIPNMVNSEMLETIPMSWVIYFTAKGAAGAIFFDELNLAAPVVAGQAYQIINERTIADRRLAPDVFVFGAGNRAGIDQAFVQEMPFPLKDRFNEFEVEPDVVSWTNWATSNKINPHLIAFVQWKNSYLYKVDTNKSNKSSTPRGIARASRLIGDANVTSDETHTMVSIAVGEGFATEFQAYTTCYSKLNWKTIFKNPESVADMTIDKKWAIIGGLSEMYIKIKKVNKESIALFAQMLDILSYMEPDFTLVGIKMIKDSDANTKKYTSLLTAYPKIEEFVEKFGKYIMS